MGRDCGADAGFLHLYFTTEELVTEGDIVAGRFTVSPSPLQGTQPMVPVVEVRGSSKPVNIFPMVDRRTSYNV
jgi:hypothetical protein